MGDHINVNVDGHSDKLSIAIQATASFTANHKNSNEKELVIIPIPRPTLIMNSANISNPMHLAKIENSLLLRIPHAIFGGILGAISGPLTPIAQCFLNVRDKLSEKKDAQRFRWPGLIDIVGNGLVVWFAITRLGTPLIYVLTITELSLSLYGFCKGIQIAWQGNLSSIPKQLWHWSQVEWRLGEVDRTHMNQINQIIQPNISAIKTDPQIKKSICQKITDTIKGACLGTFAAITSPFAQVIKQIYATPRKWPIIINQSINAYAIYVGSITIGKEASLSVVKACSSVLGSYGAIRGGKIALEEEPSKVITFLWKPGFSEKNSTALTISAAIATNDHQKLICLKNTGFPHTRE